MKYERIAVLLLGCLLTGGAVGAEEGVRIDMEGTRVIGDQELPKVLYIVPWKDIAPPGAVEPPPIVGETTAAALEREEFVRLLRYRQYVDHP